MAQKYCMTAILAHKEVLPCKKECGWMQRKEVQEAKMPKERDFIQESWLLF